MLNYLTEAKEKFENIEKDLIKNKHCTDNISERAFISDILHNIHLCIRSIEDREEKVD